MEYYHAYCLEDHGFSVCEPWSDRWNSHFFCVECGLRRADTGPISIRLTCDSIPRNKVLGAFGLWDIGFAHLALLDAFGVRFGDYFHVGLVRGATGRVIRGMRTFCSKGPRVPIRGNRPMTNDVCRTCGGINFAAMKVRNRYVVAHAPLTKPLYESNEAQLIVRSDVFARVKPILPRNVCVEKLRFVTRGCDGRSGAQLEWRGD